MGVENGKRTHREEVLEMTLWDALVNRVQGMVNTGAQTGVVSGLVGSKIHAERGSGSEYLA